MSDDVSVGLGRTVFRRSYHPTPTRDATLDVIWRLDTHSLIEARANVKADDPTLLVAAADASTTQGIDRGWSATSGHSLSASASNSSRASMTSPQLTGYGSDSNGEVVDVEAALLPEPGLGGRQRGDLHGCVEVGIAGAAVGGADVQAALNIQSIDVEYAGNHAPSSRLAI